MCAYSSILYKALVQIIALRIQLFCEQLTVRYIQRNPISLATKTNFALNALITSKKKEQLKASLVIILIIVVISISIYNFLQSLFGTFVNFSLLETSISKWELLVDK